ncbi:MAG: acetyl-CoA carboxylase biotin carboxyl carrier protein subunit [Rhodospirillales bacterium]|nr:acetyl-CoA carboxylase biotin carboxyl carrier protein subunit [Rhodospirillales bacterium]
MTETPIHPPIVGVVAQWLVEDGALVAEGEIVCQVESMKVFFEARAPVAGTLRHRVELGEVIGQEDVLAVVEE